MSQSFLMFTLLCFRSQWPIRHASYCGLKFWPNEILFQCVDDFNRPNLYHTFYSVNSKLNRLTRHACSYGCMITFARGWYRNLISKISWFLCGYPIDRSIIQLECYSPSLHWRRSLNFDTAIVIQSPLLRMERFAISKRSKKADAKCLQLTECSMHADLPVRCSERNHARPWA